MKYFPTSHETKRIQPTRFAGKKSFGSSARHDRYLTELPKIREKKGGKQTKGRNKGNQKAAAIYTTAFEKASHAPRRGSPRPRNSVCRSSDWNVRMLACEASARRTRLLSAPYRSVNDPLSRYALFFQARRAGTSFLQHRAGAWPGPCPGFSPGSLVQRNKNACPAVRVAHLPQKPKCVFTCNLGLL